jgi:hypothetical protein
VDEAERQAALRLGGCRFAPATFDKRFARDMAARAESDPSLELSDKQRENLWRLAHRFRRQLFQGGEKLTAEQVRQHFEITAREKQAVEEREWNASTDPAAMLASVQGKVSARKLRLFAVACCRAVFSLLTDERSRRAVEVAERFADGKATEEEALELARAEALRVNGGLAANEAFHCCQEEASKAAWIIARPSHSLEVRLKANLLREIVGNPWKPVTLPPGATVVCQDCNGSGKLIVPDPPGVHSSFVPTTRLCPNRNCKRGKVAGPCPWLTWNNNLVVSLARAAYEELGGGMCEECCGTGVIDIGIKGGPNFGPEVMYIFKPPDEMTCPDCHGTGRTGDGHLDPARLAVLADALEEAGCPADEPCLKCHGSGTYTVQVQNAALSTANGYGVATTYSEWRGCRHCGGDHDRKGTGRVPNPLLAHLRSPGPHVRGCAVVDLLTGKE